MEKFGPQFSFWLLFFITSNYRIISYNLSNLTKYLFSLRPAVRYPESSPGNTFQKQKCLKIWPFSLATKLQLPRHFGARGSWVANPYCKVLEKQTSSPWSEGCCSRTPGCDSDVGSVGIHRNKSLVLQSQCLSQPKRQSNQRPSA